MISIVKDKINNIKTKVGNDRKERNRILLLSFSILFIFDYIMFCYHTEKNIFNIFPNIPVLEDKKMIDVYLPSLDGKTVLKESRKVSVFDNRERFVKFLFHTVKTGSMYENTSILVPTELHIRKIWMYDNNSGKKYCLIDLEPFVIDANSERIDGSEKIFKESLEKTIIENIPSISKVILLEHGIPNRKLWDI